MRNPFARKQIAHPDAGDLYAFHQGDIITAGAETLAFDRRFSDPLFDVRHGPGINPKRQFRELQPPQVMQALVLPSSPYQGIPFGTMALQGLLDDEPMISPAGE